jgi:tight adherence protein B
MAAALALLAACGTFLLVTPAPRVPRRRLRVAVPHLPRRQMAGAALFFVVGAAVGFGLFGGLLPSLVAGGFASTFPAAAARAQGERRRAVARDAWPRLIEEIRVQVGSLGRSVPNALFVVGRRAPEELRPAFAAAEQS